MTYGYCKKIILLAERITDDEYKELMQMMEG